MIGICRDGLGFSSVFVRDSKVVLEVCHVYGGNIPVSVVLWQDPSTQYYFQYLTYLTVINSNPKYRGTSVGGPCSPRPL